MDILTLDDLRQYMLKRLGNIGTALGFDATENGALHEPAIDTLNFFEVDEPSAVTNKAQLRALAIYNALSEAYVNFTLYYDFEADNSSYNRSQVFRQVKDALDRAYNAVVLSGIQQQEIYITDVVYTD